MNYWDQFLLDSKDGVIFGSNHHGISLCAEHIKFIRNVHLEDLGLLKNRGW
jgi:hypothetical protein